MARQTENSTQERDATLVGEAIAATIILVSDPDDPKHGQITVLDDPLEAERVVESLLEAGYQQERFRVFRGKEREVQVSYRPVVSLIGDLAPVEARESADLHEDAVERAAGEPDLGPGLGVADSTNGDGQSGPRFSDFFRKSFDDAGS